MTKRLGIIIVAGAVLLAALSVVAVVWLVPAMEINSMDYILLERESGTPLRVDISAENCSYKCDGILIWSPEQAQIVMTNGETQQIWYDVMYNVFMLEKYSGCYVIKN